MVTTRHASEIVYHKVKASYGRFYGRERREMIIKSGRIDEFTFTMHTKDSRITHIIDNSNDGIIIVVKD